ncbi:MAG: glycoside hydrolase [Promethearchaeota archaeon Loki_b31]|nr:MAG: glycoside hydrolase [Candidatus Lokiarchaeota archaeon Loki_b31]
MTKIKFKDLQEEEDILNTDVRNRLVKRNRFLKREPEDEPLSLFPEIQHMLPQPIWDGHQDVLECYWKTWELAFSNLKKPEQKSGFITNFIDTAFNTDIFMWDSAFIVMFGRYGSRAFNFQKTLDNFYSHQHPDGYICRQIRRKDGAERHTKFEVSSTGPNILPWAEWEYFLNSGDLGRLAEVFYPLLAYYQWFRRWRSWQNGTYFSSGWGCGMDNQPRLPVKNTDRFWLHGHMSWIDTTLQQIFSGSILINMAELLDELKKVKDIEIEISELRTFVNNKMWDEYSSFYYDRFKDGTLSDVKTIGAYWALLANIVPKERIFAFIEHLSNPKEFNRPHRIPSLSADHKSYHPKGAYWLGGVWAPTNYMVLRGLNLVGENSLAHEIALNHLDNVVHVYKDTQTVWENYAPESKAPGSVAKDDFVGWTGLVPVSVLFENVFGIRPNVPKNQLFWDVRLLERHGIKNYPFGQKNLIDLECEARKDASEEVKINAKSSAPISLIIKWMGGKKEMKIQLEIQ